MGERKHPEGDRAQPTIGIESIAPLSASDDIQRRLMELQLRMATSSINHEYARMQFDDADDDAQRDDLLNYMHDCRREYFEARTALAAFDPFSLAEFEADLIRQKQVTLARYHA
jgi:hypothetical protein